MKKLGVVDTTFARVDMFQYVRKALLDAKTNLHVERYTVPGIKDVPVACKLLLEKHDCDICIALGMPGNMPIDKQCSHEASLGIQHVQLMTNKHVLEVFVHMDEASDDKELLHIAKDRAYKHTLNALALLKSKDALQSGAGKGKRQGKEDVGEIKLP